MVITLPSVSTQAEIIIYCHDKEAVDATARDTWRKWHKTSFDCPALRCVLQTRVTATQYDFPYPTKGKSVRLHAWSGPEGSRQWTLWHPNYFFLILAHPVHKMWIIQEPNKLALWNKLHFEEQKNGEYRACLKYSVFIFVEYIYIYICIYIYI